MARTDRTGAGRDSGTFLALGALVFAAVGLLFLVGLVMPQVLGIAAVLASLMLFGAFHYLVWGWWFTANPADQDEAAKERDPSWPPTE
jgi:hypothetical protein